MRQKGLRSEVEVLAGSVLTRQGLVVAGIRMAVALSASMMMIGLN